MERLAQLRTRRLALWSGLEKGCSAAGDSADTSRNPRI